MNLVYVIVAVWAALTFSTTLTVIILRTKGVKKVVANAVVSIEEKVEAGLEKIKGDVLSEVKRIDEKISARIDEIEIPEMPEIPNIPADLEKTLAEIYDAIPGEEDFQAIVADVSSAFEAKIASMEGVRQKAIYEFMNANEEAFKGLDAEAQAQAISGMDLASMALQEIANLKMSPSQAKKTPLAAMGLNLGKAGVAQLLMGIKNQQLAAMGQGRVTIQDGPTHSSYNPGFNP